MTAPDGDVGGGDRGMVALDRANERALVLGQSRQPLVVPEAWQRDDPARSVLGYLAALSMRQRCARTQAPTDVRTPVTTTELPSIDRSRVVPDDARAGLCRLLHDTKGVLKRRGDVPTLRIVDALAASGTTLHPFDVPVLQKLVRRLESAGDPSTAIEDLTRWEQQTPAERAATLASLRAVDPALGRDRCAAEIREQTAANRNKWLAALEVGLGPDDLPLLEAMAEDRARTVAERAAELLARLPGTTAFEERVQDALSRLKVVRGKLRRKGRVQVDVPGMIQAHHRFGWMLSTFGDVPLERTAQHLELSLEQLVAQAEDEDLRRVLYVRAVGEDHHDAARQIASGFALIDAETVIGWTGSDSALVASGWTDAQTRFAAATLFPDTTMREFYHGAALVARFYERVRIPLSVETATRLVREAEPLASRFAPSGDDSDADWDGDAETLLLWASALPSTVYSELRPLVAMLPPPQRRELTDYLNLIERIETRE